jgi:ABC-2 type transport system ATP-binding protein
MAAPAVSVDGLEKRYGDVEAVKGISFEVGVGECVAMLGPNGAGKTTTVEILEGFRPRDAGRVDVLGFDPARTSRELRERIGIVLQQSGLYKVLSVTETLELYHGLYPDPRPVPEVLGLVGLEDKARARLRTLSGGQQRRLDLALAIIGDPDLLFLDEPTTGFDPSARRRSWDLVQRLRDLGKTILLTTHYMDEAQHLADRVIVLAGGRIVAEGPPDTIGGRNLAETVISFRLPGGVGPADLPSGLPVDDDPRAELVALRTEEPTQVLHALTNWAVDRGIDLDGLTVARPSLEDVYLELTAGDADHEDHADEPADRAEPAEEAEELAGD